MVNGRQIAYYFYFLGGKAVYTVCVYVCVNVLLVGKDPDKSFLSMLGNQRKINREVAMGVAKSYVCLLGVQLCTHSM